MKNINHYKQTKYTITNNKIKPSNNSRYLFGGSWLNAKYIADMYQMYLPQYAKGRLLDLGCGYVPLFDCYKNFISECVCADWDNTLHKNDFLDEVCDLNEKLPFEDESFDTIIISDVIEHIKDPFKLMAECFRVLKKDGYLFVNGPFLYWIHESPYDYGRYTRFFYENVAELNNVDLSVLEKLGGALDVISDIYGKLVGNALPYIGQNVARINQKFHYYVLNKIPIVKKGNKAKSFALGYFAIYKK